jgi:hypothetical protein
LSPIVTVFRVISCQVVPNRSGRLVLLVTCAMSKDSKHYKFINNETGNVIYYLSIPSDKPDPEEILENARHKLAIENGIYIGSIYYIETPENESAKQ